MGRFGQVGFALLAAVLAGACSGAGPNRVMVLGLDGLDRRTVDRLIAEGKLPHFARLRQEGAYSRLVVPPSAANDTAPWTTIATGRPPHAHGARSAVWDVLATAGKKVAVVGWSAPRPTDTARGFFVSDRAWDRLAADRRAGAPANTTDDGRDVVRPAELWARLRPLVRLPEDVAREADRLRGGPAGDPGPAAPDSSALRRALAVSQTHHAIALELWRGERPDLLMVEVPLADAVSYSDGPLPAGWPSSGAAEQVRLTLERTYSEADRLVGEYLGALDGKTALAVVSDHGVARAAQGVVYLFGHGVRRGARLNGPTPLDIAPTILALARVAPPLDLPGRPATEALSFEVPGSRAPGRFAAAKGGGGRARADAAFAAGRFEEAAEAYRRLVERAPADPSLRASLAGALGAAGRHEEALRQLEVATRLAPLDPTAYHNRGATLESLGRRDEAVAQYRVALKYSPRYEPARRALLRLTGSADPDPPRNEQERRARELAEDASASARRGDYSRATELLDEAERLAPKSALVQQYRSNVAYLKGDGGAAVRALEKALKLDPGNALYAANLESLKRQGQPGRP